MEARCRTLTVAQGPLCQPRKVVQVRIGPQEMFTLAQIVRIGARRLQMSQGRLCVPRIKRRLGQ